MVQGRGPASFFAFVFNGLLKVSLRCRVAIASLPGTVQPLRVCVCLYVCLVPVPHFLDRCGKFGTRKYESCFVPLSLLRLLGAFQLLISYREIRWNLTVCPELIHLLLKLCPMNIYIN